MLIETEVDFRTINSKLREKVIQGGKGNFDAAIGVIENFEWNTTENGIECVTNLATMGVNILDSKGNSIFFLSSITIHIFN